MKSELNPMTEKNIRELIKEAVPPLDWFCDYNHPIFTLGWLEDGIRLEFHYEDEKIQKADELFLWKMYAIMSDYWCKFYEECYHNTWEYKRDFLPYEQRFRHCTHCGKKLEEKLYG